MTEDFSTWKSFHFLFDERREEKNFFKLLPTLKFRENLDSTFNVLDSTCNVLVAPLMLW